MTTLFILLAWLLLATGTALGLGHLIGRLGGEDTVESPQESAWANGNTSAGL